MLEALRATLGEITARPLPFLAEVAHFLVLAIVIGWVARRPVAKRLAARRERIGAALAEAEQAERAGAALGEEAAAAVASAERAAPALVAAAREQAEKERAEGLVQAEAEAAEALRLARETVEREKAKVEADAVERLVALTTEIARRYLDEFLGEGERRAITEQAILESLERLEHGPVPRPPE